MRWLAQTVILAYLATGLVYLPVAQAAGDTPLDSQSTSLTDYLHHHRLPLVGAQVVANSYGARQVVLYGFTATAFGKDDAAAKSRLFLHDPNVQITNRIKIRPELADMKAPHPAPATAPPAATANGDVNNYLNQQARDQQQYLQQQQNQYANQGSGSSGTAALLAGVVPLLGLGAAILGMGVGGGYGGYGAYGGYGGAPMNGYGYPGYNQYPGVAPYTAPAPYPGYGTTSPYGTYP